jgi:hypothetical protein
MTRTGLTFNPPPGWPKPPAGWVPPKGWTPDPTWPHPPPGWKLWIEEDEPAIMGTSDSTTTPTSDPPPSAADPDTRVAFLEAENSALKARLEVIAYDSAGVADLDDERVLQEIGIYQYHHPLENAVAYRDRLEDLSVRIAEMVKSGGAIEKSNTFTFDGSLAKGRSMTNDLAKLMLRAYNAEAENVVRTLRAGNTAAALKRLGVAREAIAKLASMMQLRISDAYHELRVQEIELTADYQMKREEEREAAREERERLREERKVAVELAAAHELLDKERSHLLSVVEKLKTKGETDPEIERKLAEVDNAIAQNDFRAANIRAGYVYVISNRGAFGQHVVKIGLTRRLEPMDRIHELGDASVPFKFDVHAIFFSEDAVKLETELHDHFAQHRVNWANDRKEFFFATPAEVREVLTAKVGNLLEFTEHPESTEYLQSVHYWPTDIRGPSPSA